MRDPALVDRETSYLGPVGMSGLPRRSMHIPGCAGRADGQILSKRADGAASRFLTLPSDWGTVEPGVFTADVELFLVDGSLHVDGAAVEPHSVVSAPQNALVTSIRSPDGATVLASTSSPVRFVPTDHGNGRACVVSSRASEWTVDGPGLFVKTLDAPGPYSTRLVLGGHVDLTSWKRLPSWSERLLIEGEWREHTVGESEDPVVYVLRPYAYVSRPAGTPFDGPEAGTDSIALFVERTLGSWEPMAG